MIENYRNKSFLFPLTHAWAMTIFLPGMSVQKIEFVFLQKTIDEEDRDWSVLSEPTSQNWREAGERRLLKIQCQGLCVAGCIHVSCLVPDIYNPSISSDQKNGNVSKSDDVSSISVHKKCNSSLLKKKIPTQLRGHLGQQFRGQWVTLHLSWISEIYFLLWVLKP